jgi:hypothetical protein
MNYASSGSRIFTLYILPSTSDLYHRPLKCDITQPNVPSNLPALYNEGNTCTSVSSSINLNSIRLARPLILDLGVCFRFVTPPGRSEPACESGSDEFAAPCGRLSTDEARASDEFDAAKVREVRSFLTRLRPIV